MDAHTWRSEQLSQRITTGHHEFEVAYREIGSGDPVTVFIHGIPTWSYLYREVCDAVEHAVLPDLPGYGYTRHVGENGYDRSVASQAEYVDALLEALDLSSVQVVAHDIGGAVALRLALETDRVDRLVLSNATTYDSWPIEAILELGLPNRARNMTYKEIDRTLRALFSNGLYNDERATDSFVDGMIEPFLDRPVTDLSRNAISLNTNHTLEIAHRITELSVPTLLLWGVPGSGQHVGYANRLARDLPDVEKRYLRRSYHWVMQERPDAYREALAEFSG